MAKFTGEEKIQAVKSFFAGYERHTSITNGSRSNEKA